MMAMDTGRPGLDNYEGSLSLDSAEVEENSKAITTSLASAVCASAATAVLGWSIGRVVRKGALGKVLLRSVPACLIVGLYELMNRQGYESKSAGTNRGYTS